MGGSCSTSIDAWTHLASTEEVRGAVRGIEAWQKAQEQNRAAGGANRASSKGPLLQRVGGVDVVKRVVEGFYRRLYGDPRLIVYLQDKSMVYLRAKQTMFMSWLFGPPNKPYNGRNVRIAHLRIIKQRGFCADDFDIGMRYFEEALREMDAPDNLVSEVMLKVRPFKDAIFTPSAKDSEEEARWAMEERIKQQLAHQQAQDAEKAEKARQLLGGSQSSMPRQSQSGTPPPPAAAAAAAAAVTPRGSQCPFTGARLSRPSSAVGTPTAAAAITAVVKEAAASSRPVSAASGRTSPKPGLVSAEPAKPQSPRPASASKPAADSSAAAPKPDAGVQPPPSPSTPPPNSPLTGTTRPRGSARAGSASSGSSGAAAGAAAAPPPPGTQAAGAGADDSAAPQQLASFWPLAGDGDIVVEGAPVQEAAAGAAQAATGRSAKSPPTPTARQPSRQIGEAF